MANCTTTRVFLSTACPPPVFTDSFNTAPGWKPERKNAGYNAYEQGDPHQAQNQSALIEGQRQVFVGKGVEYGYDHLDQGGRQE